MKKHIGWILCALFAFQAAYAEIVVKQGAKEYRYADQATVTVQGTEDATVNYRGTTVFIPKENSVSLAPSKGKSFAIMGKNIKGVEVYGVPMNSKGHLSVIVTPNNRTIAVNAGTLQLQNSDGKVTTLGPGAVVAVTKKAAPAVAQTAPAKKEAAKEEATKPAAQPAKSAAPAAQENTFVVINNLAAQEFSTPSTQQAVQDIEEEEALSPSAPY